MFTVNSVQFCLELSCSCCAHSPCAALSALCALLSSSAQLCSAGVERCLRASFPLLSSSLAAEEEEEEEEEKGGAAVAVAAEAEEGDRKKTDSCWLVGCWFLAWWLLLFMLRFHLFVYFFHALGLLFPCFRLSAFLCVCFSYSRSSVSLLLPICLCVCVCVCFDLPRSFVCKLWGLSIHLAGAVSLTFAVDTSSCLEFAFCVPRTPRMYNANIWVPEKESGETETERGIHT